MVTTASDDIKSPAMPAAARPPPPAPQPSSTDEGDGAGKTGFTSLPEELVSNIAVKLGSDDMFALRLTCKDLEAKSLHEFATEYFSAKCFMFTTESLKTLVNIAKSQRLRHFLQRVYLITASVTDRQVKCCQHGHCMWNPTVREHEAFLLYKNDQKRLYDEGGDKKFLTGAFANLPRMQKLILVDQVNGLPLGVKCHGIAKFRRTTSISPAFKPLDGSYAAEYYPWLTHVFRTMMLAVAESGITTITHLATDFHLDHRTLDGLSPLTDLQFKAATLAKLTKAFGNLSQLDLCLRSHSLRVGKKVGKKDSTEDLKQVARSAKAFGRVLGNVTSLGLNFDMGKWSGTILKAFTSNMDLSKLTAFSLDSVLIDTKAFAAMVCRLQSAQNITLTLVELNSGSWVPILKAFQALPQLDHLHMRYLQEDGHKCFFLEKPDGDEEEDDLTEPSWFDPLTGEMGGREDDEDDGDWADEEEDGESMPDLIEQDGTPLVHNTVDASSSKAKGEIPVPTQNETPTQDAPKRNDCPHHTGKDHRAPRMKSGERGYHICLQGEEIQEQLPTFIKEYNLGGNFHDDLDFGGLLGNLAQQMPPGIGGMGDTFTIPVPIPAGPPPPPAPGAQAPQGGPPPPGVPPITLGGLYSLLGGGPIQGPFGSTLTTAPPPPGAAPPTAPAAPNGQATAQAHGSNAASPTTATSSTTAGADLGEHEEGWWDEGEVVRGDLDDVD